MLAILIGTLATAVVAAVIVGVLNFFSSESRAVRSATKESAKELQKTRRQLQVARDSLIKIAAEDAGNPALEARLALGEISQKELGN